MYDQVREEPGRMTSSNRKRHPGRRRPGLVASVAVTALGLMASVAAVSSVGASATTSGNSGNTGSGSSAAVITPLLKMFEFGNGIGLPLACSDAGSVVSIIGTQTGGTAVASKLVTQLDNQCAALAAKGGTYLQQAIAQSRALSLLNPVVDPLIAALSEALSSVGTQFGPSLSPFGPTVAGLGGTVTFFEGT
jgi:hypothetical protein